MYHYLFHFYKLHKDHQVWKLTLNAPASNWTLQTNLWHVYWTLPFRGGYKTIPKALNVAQFIVQSIWKEHGTAVNLPGAGWVCERGALVVREATERSGHGGSCELHGQDKRHIKLLLLRFTSCTLWLWLMIWFVFAKGQVGDWKKVEEDSMGR